MATCYESRWLFMARRSLSDRAGEPATGGGKPKRCVQESTHTHIVQYSTTPLIPNFALLSLNFFSTKSVKSLFLSLSLFMSPESRKRGEKEV